MQHVSAVDFASLSPAAAKKAALAAFSAAVLDPHGADWQAVAYGLNAALTAKRAAKAEEPAADGFLPWYYPDRESYPKGHTTRPRIDFVFSDGVTVSAAAWQKPGKPINIGMACRVALDMHRAKVRNAMMRAFPELQLQARHSSETVGVNSPLSVPAIVSAVYRDTGEAWNVDTLNRETEADRARRIDGMALVEAEDLEAAAYEARKAFSDTGHQRELAGRIHREGRRNAVARVLETIGERTLVYKFDRYDISRTLRHVIAADPLAYPCDGTVADTYGPGMVAAYAAEWGITDTPSDAPLTPSDVPSRVQRLRLVALNSTAGVPLAAPVALRRDVSIRLAA